MQGNGAKIKKLKNEMVILSAFPGGSRIEPGFLLKQNAGAVMLHISSGELVRQCRTNCELQRFNWLKKVRQCRTDFKTLKFKRFKKVHQ